MSATFDRALEPAQEALAAGGTDVAATAARAYTALQEKRGAPREAIGGVEQLAEALEKAGAKRR